MSETVFKDAVIGWVVLKCRLYHNKPGKPEYFLSVMPLAVNWEGLLDDSGLDIENGDEVITVIPAAPGTCQVWGAMESGECVVLGYEIPGAYTPNWEELVREKQRKARQNMKKAVRDYDKNDIYDKIGGTRV